MGSAVANYLRNYLEDGSAVGIVKFSSSTTLLADMTTIVDEGTRTTLISVVPTTVGGGTSIGAGMLRCGEVSQLASRLCLGLFCVGVVLHPTHLKEMPTANGLTLILVKFDYIVTDHINTLIHDFFGYVFFIMLLTISFGLGRIQHAMIGE